MPNLDRGTTTDNIHSSGTDWDYVESSIPDPWDSPEADDRWMTTPEWFESEAQRYEDMGSPLAAFLAACVREIAADFAAFDTECPHTYMARRATYQN